MANIKISELNSLTGANLNGTDLLPIVDSSETETKSVTIAGLKIGLFGSPSLTGTPTAPTATAGTDTTQIATTEFVTAAVGSGGGGGGSTTLAGLTDTTITSIGDGEIISYDNASSKYVNKTLAEAGIAPLASPTFTGNPQSNAAPTSGDHLSNKTYVDGQVQQADGHTVLVKKVTGSEIMALTTAESDYITMIAAPGAGKFIVVRQLEVYIDRGSWTPMQNGDIRGYGDELQLAIKNPVVNQSNYQWNTYGVLQKKILNHLINNTFNTSADPDVILVRDAPVTQTRAYADVPLLLRPKSANTIGNLNTYSQTVDDDYYFRISYKIMDLSTDFAET